jgi:hypothetical protein
MKEFKINSLTELSRAITEIDGEWHQHHYLEITIKRKAKQRTDQQRKAIEVYCRDLAYILNRAGLDQRKVFAAMREGVDIPWRQESVKDSLWRPIQVAILNKESTTKLNADEVTRVYDTLNRWTGTTFGIAVQFPDSGPEWPKKKDK